MSNVDVNLDFYGHMRQAASYFCPVSDKFSFGKTPEDLDESALGRFNAYLTLSEKVITVVLTIFATIASLPILGLGGLATFRAVVGKYTVLKFNHNKSILDDPNKVQHRDHLGYLITVNKVNNAANPQGGGNYANNPVNNGIDPNQQPQDQNNLNPPQQQPRHTIDDASLSEILDAEEVLRRRMDDGNVQNQNVNLLEQIKLGLPKAEILHQEFLEKIKEAPPTFADGVVSSSLFQLKAAIKMAKKAFPASTRLAFTEEHRAHVARLVQIIMCGAKAKNAEAPTHPCCFKIRELDNKKIVSNEVFSEGSSYLNFILENMQEKEDCVDQLDQYQQNMQLAFSRFASNCLETANPNRRIVSINKVEIAPDKLFETIRAKYLEFLADEDANSLEEIKNNSKITHLYTNIINFSGINEDLNKNCWLPESMLIKVFENSPVKDKLQPIIELTRVTDEELQGTGRTKDEIEPLLRIKFLELMVMLNDQNLATSKVILDEVMNYTKEEASQLCSSAEVCQYNIDNDLSTVACRTKYAIGLSSHLSSMTDSGILKDHYSIATVNCKEKVIDFSTDAPKRNTEIFRELKFSWQISEEALDGIVEQIDPDLIKAQPFEHVKESLEDVSKMWQEIAQKTVTGKEVLFLVRELESTGNLVGLYCTLAKEQGKTDEAFIQSLVTLREALDKVRTMLVQAKTQLEEDGKDEDAYLFGRIIPNFVQEISRLPRKKEVEKGYIEKLWGMFFQSNDGKDISWKVKKYEVTIAKLIEAFENNFTSEELVKTALDTSSIYMSFIDLGSPAECVKQLYATLKSVELKDEDDRFNQAYLKQVRDLYNEKFVPQLRRTVTSLLELPPENIDNKAEKEMACVFKICNLLFTEIDIEDYCQETIDLFDEMGEQVLGPDIEGIDGTFVHHLETLYDRINAVPYSAKAPIQDQLGNSARGQWNRDFDPYRQGNPVHVQYQIEINGKYVKAIGMGTPTVEDKKGKASIVPEFKGMLQHYRRENKKHLYVSNQNTIPKEGISAALINGDETNRSDVILDLQDGKDYKGAYFAIALSKNSSFYYQKGKFKDKNDAVGFKAELYSQIFLMDRAASGCYIPDSIKQVIANKDNNKALKLIDDIHADLFGGRQDLTEAERKLFIEIYYDHLTKMILVDMDIDSYNISCKDKIDRGAGSDAQLYALAAIVADLFDVLEHSQRIILLMMIRALLVRKRAPIHERFERFIQMLEFALANKEKFKKLHATTFGVEAFTLHAPGAEQLPKLDPVPQSNNEQPQPEPEVPQPQQQEEGFSLFGVKFW